MLRAKPRPTRHSAAESRAWRIAQELRARRGWLLDAAQAQRSWSVRLGEAAFEVSAWVSFFFQTTPGGMVVALESSFPKALPPATVEEAVRNLRASVDERYRPDPSGRTLTLNVGTDKPKELLAEIAHVEHVFGARASRRFGPSPRAQDRRLWQLVEALRGSSWQISSLIFSRRAGDDHRHLWASISTIVDSGDGRPGIGASFVGWVPRPTKRWTRFRDDTATGLTAAGFRTTTSEPRVFHLMRLDTGLSGTRALKHADVLDQWIEAGVDVVGI